MIRLPEAKEARALLAAAVYAYSRLHGDDSGGMDRAWEAFAAAAKKSPEELRRYRSTLTDDEIVAVAELAVTQALLGQEWLRRWLEQTHHPKPQPPFTKFMFGGWPRPDVVDSSPVMEQLLGGSPVDSYVKPELLAALDRQAAVVELKGDEGSGMTQALLSVAVHFRNLPRPCYRFVIWFQGNEAAARGDADPLTTLLTEILLVARHPQLVDCTPSQKMAAAADLLARRPALIVMDNLHRIRQPQLCEWLVHLPYPNKALVSTTDTEEMSFCLQGSVVSLKMKNLYPLQRSMFQHQLAKEYGLAPEDIGKILTDTNDNLRMTRLAAAYLSYSPQEVGAGSLAHKCLDEPTRRNCELLDPEGRRLLLALVPFTGNYASQTVLRLLASGATTWDDPAPSTTAPFRRGLQQLVDLALAEEVETDGRKGVKWDESVRRIALKLWDEAKFPPDGYDPDCDSLFRRWVLLYCDLGKQVGYCPQDHTPLDRLDGEMYILPSVISYVDDYVDHPRFEYEAIRLARGWSYYYYVRGYWANYQSPHLVAYDAAQRLLKNLPAVDTAHRAEVATSAVIDLAFEVEWLIKRGNLAEIQRKHYWQQLQALREREPISDFAKLIYLSSYAYYLMEVEQERNLAVAESLLNEAIHVAEQALEAKPKEADQASLLKMRPELEERYLKHFRYLAIYRAAQCIAGRDSGLADALLAQYIGNIGDDDKRTANRMRLLRVSLLLQRGQQEEAQRELAVVGKEVLETENYPDLAGFLKELREARRIYAHDFKDPTQLARFLEYYAQAHPEDAPYADLQLAKMLYHQLSRPTLVAHVDQLLEDDA